MRVPSTVAFNQFLLANGQKYPYSKLQATRSSFFCKWIMTKGYSIGGETEYFPVLANSKSNGVLLEMIRSRDAMPLPQELSEIMDHMRDFGIKLSVAWYESVVEMLNEALNGEVEIERHEFVSMLISPLVLEEIHRCYDVDSVAEHLLVLEWMKWYVRTYRKGKGDDFLPFGAVAEQSLEHVKTAIWLMQHPIIVID
jgi:hypothetical protein